MTSSEELVLRASVIPTAVLSDASGGAGVLEPEIFALERRSQICGRARTAACAAGDVLASLRTLVRGEPGEVLVVGGLNAPLACLGAFMAATCQQRGIVGAVLDGFVRDYDEIVASGFPVFCRGATPRIATTGQGGQSQVPTSCGGVVVRPGDLIRGDSDGVIGIPWADVPAVLDQANAILAKEAEALALMKAGGGLEVLYGKYLGDTTSA